MDAADIEHGQIIGVSPIENRATTYNQGEPNEYYKFNYNGEVNKLFFDENVKVSENTSAPILNRDMDPPLINMEFAKEHAELFYLVEEASN